MSIDQQEGKDPVDVLGQENGRLRQALEESRLREQAALAEAQRQKLRLERFIAQVPAAVCVLDGPEMIFELVNPAFGQLYPGRDLPGKRVLEALPEMALGPFYSILENIYQTGEPFEGKEVLFPLALRQGGPVEDVYFNFIYQPRFNELGEVDGILAFGYEVTSQVLARKQVEESRQVLQALNQELEARVESRTRQIQEAQAQAEAARQQLYALFEQAPVAITILEGEQYVIRLANPAVCEIWGRTGQQVTGRPLFEAMPEIRHQGLEALLYRVRNSGEPYVGNEQPVELDRNGEREKVYLNFVYHPLRDEQGVIGSIAVVATDVTEQVKARQMVEANALTLQRLNQELTTSNAELQAAQRQIQAANEDLVSANAQLRAASEALQATHEQLTVVNEALEERVKERTLALTQSEERYRVFIQQSSEGICRFELEHIDSIPVDMPEQEQIELFSRYGYLAECNDAMARMYGYGKASELVGARLEDFLPISVPANRDYFASFIRSDYRLKDAETVELDQWGEPKYFLNNMVGVLEGGKLLRAWCTQRDITTQKEAQEGLRSSEAQLRLLTDALPVSIVYVDKERRYRFANRTALAWRQGPGETIIGKRVEDVLSEQAYQTVRDYLEQAFAGQVVRFERFIEYADGKRYTQNQLVPHLEEGEVQGVYGLVMDITRQVEARKEADRQRQRLNDLFLQAPAPICILDGADLVFELVNPACQQLFPGRKLLGKAILEALPELNGTPIWQTFRRVYQTGQTHEEKEVLIAVARYEDGALEDRYFHYIQQARYDWEGKVDGVVVFAFEVTEQVEARQKVEQSERQLQFLNEELASANEELRAANEKIQASNEELAGSNRQLTRINQDLDNFVYTASHDLKAPILNVEGLLRAMEKQLSQEISHNQTVQQIYQLLYGSVSRFKATIGDLTEVARISKESSEDVALITLAEILQEVLKDLEPQIQQAQAQVTVTLDCDDLLFSRKNLKSVLYNLISNALKYRSPDREPLVTIYCHTQEHYYLLTVQDNGLGMDMRQEEKIFALFKRLHNHVEGTGIGLYIVKKIVENAGGKIEVNSQVGVGSVFKVYFKR